MSFNLDSITRGVATRPPRVVLLGVEKIGKALAVDTPIPTPVGFTELGDLAVGDTVFDKDGRQATVTRATDTMHGRPCFRVTFADGSELIADERHQWLVHSVRDNREIVKTTREIASAVMPPSGDRYNFSAPITGPLQTSAAVGLPIDPYTLGVWLGDGTSAVGAVTIADRDSDILSHIQGVGKRRSPDGSCAVYTICGLTTVLRANDLLNNKHIPETYFLAGESQRLALLQGLMDTDGHCSDNHKGQCEFSSVVRESADDFRRLIRTLGIKSSLFCGEAKIDGRVVGPSYRVSFFPTAEVFRTEFKAKRLAGRTSKRKCNKNAIVSVEPVGSVPVKCIEVDSASHTYLAGESYTVTHNSTWASAWPDTVGIPIVGEEGIDDIDVSSFPTGSSLSDVFSALNTLRTDEHEYATVFLDSASALEPLIHVDVCKANGNVDSIEKVGGGYGKGYTISLNYWRMLTQYLDVLRTERNMASIIIGHVKVKRFDDPAGSSYDQYQFDIHDKAANLLYRWADLILFANTKVVVKKEDIGFGKKHATGIEVLPNARFLYTQKRPAHPGGGRGVFGRLPYELPLNYSAFVAAVLDAGQIG